MNDWIHKLLKMMDHNRYLSAAGAATVAMVLFGFGCESTTVVDGQRVTRTELQIDHISAVAHYEGLQADIDANQRTLNAEIEASAAKNLVSIEDINRKNAMKSDALSKVGELIASASSGNFAGAVIGAVSIAAGLLGVGAVADNRRKDKTIVSLKNGSSEPQ